MIITHLAVSGVGRFRTRHVVKGFGRGLNLLCAPNEYGKSTLFRALQACLFSRHTSGTEDLRALATLRAQLPASIEVGFERDGVRYRVQKAFVQSRTSRLFRNGELVAEGRPADEQLWSILGVHEAGRSVDESTFGLLWVRQGASFGPLEASDTARSTLNRLIEAEVGQVLGGERGERVLATVHSHLSKLETERGAPKAGGEWKRAIDAEAALRAELDKVHARRRELDGDLQALQAKLSRQRELEDPGTSAAMRADLDRASQELAAAERTRSLLETALSEVTRHALALELAGKRERELAETDKRIAECRRLILELERQRTDLDAAYRGHAAAVADMERAAADADQARSASEAELDRLDRLAVAVANLSAIDDLESRLQRARAARDRLAVATAALKKDGLPLAQLRRIEAASAELETKRHQLEAKAPQVSIQLAPGAAHRVRLQGTPVETSHTLAATSPLKIEIENIASVLVTPVMREDDGAAVEAAQETLARELAKAGVASLGEARQRRARTEQLEDEQRAQSANLAAIAPAGKDEDGVAILERRLAAMRAPFAGFAGDVLRCAAAEPEALAAKREHARCTRDDSRRRHGEVQTALATAKSELAGAEFRRTACRTRIAEEQAKLDRDMQAAPDSERAARLARLASETREAREAMHAAEERAAALRATLPSDEQRSALVARVKRLTEAIENRDTERRQIELDVTALRTRVATQGGEGLGEREAALQEQLAMAERSRAHIESRIASLRLLRETIETCRSEAREAYLAPINRGVQPFLHALFPGAEAAFDENFAVQELRRNGDESEPFNYLSYGTREQIAVMVRLAFGGLLADRGKPSPVLLDDALVFSDDERIERMFDALTQAAEKHQVIVLTCRSRAFESFGGQRLTVEPEERT